MRSERVIVASENPVKIRAVERALARLFPATRWEVRGQAVSVPVPAQPLSDAETRRGARARAAAARQLVPQARWWVGIEGGVQPGRDASEPWMALAWIAILDASGHEGLACAGRFPLPPPVVAELQKGLELGAADDRVFGTRHSKRHLGAIGLLSHGALDRTELYAQGVLLALLPFRNPELYFGSELE
ncbi:MAG: inosine/xanthosine triphosphatase [Chloroflexi bacterium]|nr:inosine/xanthosine triphosphatase [Chloroflexota bacterium]